MPTTMSPAAQRQEQRLKESDPDQRVKAVIRIHYAPDVGYSGPIRGVLHFLSVLRENLATREIILSIQTRLQ